MSRRVLFIVNPQAAAGRAGRLWPTFLARLPKDRLVVDCLSTTAPGHALALAGDAAERYDVVAAAGGDGTVNEVASGLLLAERGRALLGIVPLGTGNDAACQAGLRGLDQALAALTDGVPRAVDAVEVDYVAAGQKARHYALLFAAVGFAGELIKRTTPRVKRWFGPRLCYTVGFLRALWG
jgi:diacylglycerol kinase family enzyme